MFEIIPNDVFIEMVFVLIYGVGDSLKKKISKAIWSDRELVAIKAVEWYECQWIIHLYFAKKILKVFYCSGAFKYCYVVFGIYAPFKRKDIQLQFITNIYIYTISLNEN